MIDLTASMSSHLMGTWKKAILSIGVRFDVNDFRRWATAVGKVETFARHIEYGMQRDCAIELADDIYTAIKTGKYSYQPYNPRYEKWKSEYFPGRPFWELKSDLANNLRAFKVEDGWAAGVPAGVMDSGGKSWLGTGDKGPRKEIAWYGAINEARRPLFKPESQAYASGNKWRAQGSKALRYIKTAWR